MHKALHPAPTRYFISGVILLIFPIFVTMMWFRAATIGIDAAEAAAIFRSHFLFFKEIWVVVLVSLACCLATIYCTKRSMKHTNFWVKNLSLMCMFMAIIFAVLDIKWLLMS